MPYCIAGIVARIPASTEPPMLHAENKESGEVINRNSSITDIRITSSAISTVPTRLVIISIFFISAEYI